MPRYIKAEDIRPYKGFFEKVDNVPKFYDWVETLPTADVVEKERYDILLEHANILAEELRKYQNADVTERNVGKWIPVTERLPEVGKFVLVNDIYMDELTIAKLLEDKEWEDQHGNWSSFGCVSAWMPLPEVYGG